MAASRTYSLSARNGKPVVDRVSFAKIHEPLQLPNLLGLQTDSFGWLVGSEQWTSQNPGSQSGLEEIFEEISPIENAAQTMGLVLSSPHLEDPKYSIAECRERDLTYAAPLYVTAEFQNYETGEIKSQTTFIGDFPLMTERGTFIINGTERVVVSQLVRSPGVYYERLADKTSDKDVFNVKIIPSRGAWLEFEIDKRDAVGVRVDRKRKQSVTVFLKALGMSESEIREIFGDFPALIETLEKDTVHTQEEALTDLYRKLRPGEPPTAEAGRALLNNFYFNTKRYDTAKVGRFKLNKKLKALARRSALSYKASSEAIIVVENFELAAPKTKDFVALSEALHVADQKALFVVEALSDNLVLSSRNLPSARVMNAFQLNTYSVLDCKKLVLTEAAVAVINEQFKA